MTEIINGRLIDGSGIRRGNILIDGGVIVSVSDRMTEGAEVIDAAGCCVSPGFADIHIHGGNGLEFSDSRDDYISCLRYQCRHGTTSIVPTVSTTDDAGLRHFLDNVRFSMEEPPEGIPRVLGAHLEGPYLSLAQCGAQNPELICDPDPAQYTALLRDYRGVILRWSFAPERPGSAEFTRALLGAGVIPAIAHTEAVWDDVKRSYDEGVRLLTHFYSGMNGVTRRFAQRYLGAVESGYLLDDMNVEVIADGHHLPPELIRLIVKVKGTGHIALITDSIRGVDKNGNVGAGIKDSRSVGYIVKDGVAYLPDMSCFAGSIATTGTLVRTMYRAVGVSLPDITRMLCFNPLRFMGVNNGGELTAGSPADIVVYDNDINIQRVFVSGKEIN